MSCEYVACGFRAIGAGLSCLRSGPQRQVHTEQEAGGPLAEGAKAGSNKSVADPLPVWEVRLAGGLRQGEVDVLPKP